MSTLPSPLPSTHGAQRRGSLARYFGKVKTAMKRSRSTTKALPQSPPVVHDRPTEPTTHVSTTPPEPTKTRDEEPSLQGRTVNVEATPATPIDAPAELLPLAAENGIEADLESDDEEPLLPMFSSRNGITEDRARDLFAKYGLDYMPRNRPAHGEPPTKLRRVEKAVRLRIHWTCHECRRQFATEKTCTACGHRRCRECTRLPAKKVRQLMEVAREQMQQSEHAPVDATAQAQPPLLVEAVAVEPVVETGPEEPSESLGQQPPTSNECAPNELPRTSAPAVPGDPLSQPLERDESRDERDFSLTEIQYSIHSRPRTSARPLLQQHAKPTPPQNWTTGKHLEQEVPMVRAVQRVYRKPRQRVRYTCERCSTLFVAADRCVECGHERCHDCHREPPKRPPREHDPEVLRSLANRLAGYGGGTQTPAIITS